ncbi:MAG: tetratricopeptide repeat protein [Holophagales bacterium]|nr:MAG: tetratricopeptide repeat protein [Holophagales bacterium]
MSQLHRISGCGNTSRKADVVFIHGLGGDPFTTWRHGDDDSTSWPHWLGSEFPEVGVWSLGYAASPSRWARLVRLFGLGSRDSGHTMSLPDRAAQVLDLMKLKGLGDRPLLFICHSLGGLVAKQVLRKASDAPDERKQQVVRQTRAVLFLATPHAGAELATLAHAFRAVFGATVSMEDLRAHDSHLLDLYDWYRNQSPPRGIQTVTYYERRGLGGVLPIVNPTSSHPGVGADPVALDEDHLSIVKPREPDAQVCCAARDLLRRVVLASPPAVSSPPSAPDNAPRDIVLKLAPGLIPTHDAPRLPRELPPAAHQFFGRDAERQQLVERLQAGLSTAVVGPAGMGKTALAAEALEEVAGADACNLATTPFPDGILYLDLYTYQGQAEPAWNGLANRLRGPEFLETRPARDRAIEACRARRILVIVEGGEEADGDPGRTTIPELFSVLSPENRWLLLTRVSTQAAAAETVRIQDALSSAEAAALLDWLTRRQPLRGEVRAAVLELLEGHPLAINWAGSLLALDEEEPASLVCDWRSRGLPTLSDPRQAEHTLQWLFARSVRGLEEVARQALAAAGLLARAPFPLKAIVAALGREDDDSAREEARRLLRLLVQRGLLRTAGTDSWQFTHVLGYRFARNEDGADPTMLERLGLWLHSQLVGALQRGVDTEALANLGRPMQHVAAVLRADSDQRLWEPLAHALLYDVSDRLEDLGRLDLVTRGLRAVADWMDRLPAEVAQQPRWLGERCVLVVDQGDVLRDQGDLDGALAAFHEALATRQRLARVDPLNTTWQRNLGVSFQRVGDVLREQGDLDGALDAFQEARAWFQRLVKADPSDVASQRSLGICHAKVGDVLRDQGDPDGALIAVREAVAGVHSLVEADSSNETLLRDLGLGQERIGGILFAQGDLSGALVASREALAIRQRLAKADPSNATWQRDLSVSHNKVGEVLRAQGDLDGALAAFRESLAISQRLAKADPSNAIWQRDLSVSHDKVGEGLRAQGDLDGALDAFRHALVISRRLAQAHPSIAAWQRDFSYCLRQLAEFHEQRGQPSVALPFAEESLSIDERLSELDRSNATWQRDVAVSQALVARLRGH